MRVRSYEALLMKPITYLEGMRNEEGLGDAWGRVPSV